MLNEDQIDFARPPAPSKPQSFFESWEWPILRKTTVVIAHGVTIQAILDSVAFGRMPGSALEWVYQTAAMWVVGFFYSNLVLEWVWRKADRRRHANAGR